MRSHFLLLLFTGRFGAAGTAPAPLHLLPPPRWLRGFFSPAAPSPRGGIPLLLPTRSLRLLSIRLGRLAAPRALRCVEATAARQGRSDPPLSGRRQAGRLTASLATGLTLGADSTVALAVIILF